MNIAKKFWWLSTSGESGLTVTLTSDASDPLSEYNFITTAVFSREVTALEAADFSLTNASVGGIFTNDNITWYITIQPTYGGNVAVSIPAGNVAGATGGTNEVSNTISVTIASDYTGNILDEWFPTRGATINVAGTNVASWKGVRNNVSLNGVGSIFPSAGKYNFSGTNYFNAGNATALGWVGNFSIFLRIKAAAVLTQDTEVIWNSIGGDDLRLYAKVSAAAPRIGIRAVATVFTGTSTWPQDGLDHCVGFTVDFTAGTCKYYLDGVLTETIAITTGTGADYTTTANSAAFGRLNSTIFYSQSFNKVRVYKEAVSETNAAIISNQSNLFGSFNIVETKQTKVFIFAGESIMRGYTAVATDFPVELQQEFVDILGWSGVTEGFKTTLAGTRPVTECGPQIKALYDLRVKYPDFNLIYFFSGSAGATLDLTPSEVNSWNSVGGDLLDNLLASALNGLKVTVDIELRNIESINWVMAQGINDCDNLTRANNYQANLEAFNTFVRANFGYGGDFVNKIVWAGPHDRLPAGSHPYDATVRTAIATVDTADANFASIVPDNVTTYPLEADSIHYTPTGTVNLGAAMADLL